MKIRFYVLPGEKIFSLKVSPSETIRDVKEKVQNCQHIPIYRQIIHHDSFDLRDEWTVSQCNLHHGTCVLLLLKDERRPSPVSHSHVSSGMASASQTLPLPQSFRPQPSPSQMVPNPLPPPPSTVTLNVKVPRSQDRIPIEMEKDETILHLKVKIAARQDMRGIPVERIELQSPSMRVGWHDDKVLQNIIFSESADIDVFLKPS